MPNPSPDGLDPRRNNQDGSGYRPEFIAIPYAVFTDRDLSHAAKLTYGRLKLYAGKDGRCYPKHETLASEVCLRGRQLRTVLSELRAAGWVDWQRSRTSCIYTVFSDRQKTATPSGTDRQQTAGESGRRPPLRPAENRLSRSAEDCQQNRSIERTIIKRGIEKRSVAFATTRAAAGLSPPGNPVAGILEVDDEKNTTGSSNVYANPADELRAIYRRKTGAEISPDVERRVWETVELRGVPRTRFMEQLRRHTENVWRNPAGFLTSFARKIGSVFTPDPPWSSAPEPPKDANGRCSSCCGIGYAHWDADLTGRQYCECSLGRELKRVDESRARELVAAAACPSGGGNALAVEDG